MPDSAPAQPCEWLCERFSLRAERDAVRIGREVDRHRLSRRADALCIKVASTLRVGLLSKELLAFCVGAPPGAATVPLRRSRPEHPERGTPSSPPGMGVPFHSLKENTMFTVPVTRVMRAGCVLLGGSGRARMLTLQSRPLAALFRPSPHDLVCPDQIPDHWARMTQ